MRQQTAREKAEAFVAMVRAEYPNPLRVSDPGPSDGKWYCVAVAYGSFQRAHPELGIPPAVTPRTINLNNQGKFEEAWSALTDELEKALEA